MLQHFQLIDQDKMCLSYNPMQLKEAMLQMRMRTVMIEYPRYER